MINPNLIKFFKMTVQPAGACVLLCLSDEQYQSVLEMEGIEDGGNHNGAFLFNGEEPLRYILHIPLDAEVSVIYHEALHCATRMYYDMGANLDAHYNDEVLCYTQTHIVEEINKFREIYLNMRVEYEDYLYELTHSNDSNS